MQKIGLLFFVITSFWACSSTKKLSPNQEAQPIPNELFPVTAADSAEAKAFFIKGVVAFEEGDAETALDLFTNAMIKLPNEPGIQFALADAYLAIGDPANALYYANQAAKNEPNNRFYQLKVIEIHESNGDLNAAIETLQSFIQTQETTVELRYKLADLHAKNGQLEQSNAVYGSIIRQYGTDEPSHYRRYLNFSQLGQKDSALVELQALSDINPMDTQLRYSVAEMQLSMGNTESAEYTLLTLLERNLNDAAAYRLLVKLYVTNQNEIGLDSLTYRILHSDDLGFLPKEQYVRYVISQIEATEQDQRFYGLKKVSEYAKVLIERHPKQSDAYVLLGSLQNVLNEPLEAKNQFEKAVELNASNQNAWLELVQLYLATGSFSTLIERAGEIDQAVPENAFVEYAIGAAHFSTQNYQQAVTWLKKATYAPARREFKSVIHTIMGDAYYQLDRWESAAEAYDAAIKLDPNNATALNNYAYYLSVRGEKLNEAKLMSKKSLDIEPENPSFLDTYGWILYQNELYDDAKIYIQKAIDAGGGSAEVYEHLGDVNEKLNNLDEAKLWWKKALELEPTRTYLQKKLGHE